MHFPSYYFTCLFISIRNRRLCSFTGQKELTSWKTTFPRLDCAVKEGRGRDGRARRWPGRVAIFAAGGLEPLLTRRTLWDKLANERRRWEPDGRKVSDWRARAVVRHCVSHRVTDRSGLWGRLQRSGNFGRKDRTTSGPNRTKGIRKRQRAIHKWPQ